jgi:hypothetical protein
MKRRTDENNKFQNQNHEQESIRVEIRYGFLFLERTGFMSRVLKHLLKEDHPEIDQAEFERVELELIQGGKLQESGTIKSEKQIPIQISGPVQSSDHADVLSATASTVVNAHIC